jgi:adenine-specific DNA methylase
LYLNPRVTVKALSEATGISVLEINRYVKEGRLDISDEVSQVNNKKVCLDCGQVIDYGNLCLFCKKNREELKQSKNMNENQNQKNKNKFFTKRDN